MKKKLVLGLALSAILLFRPFLGYATETLFIWPVKGPDKVILRYNETYKISEGGIEKEKTHWGIDIEAPEGTEVVAAAGGKVIFAGFTPSGEGTVSIEHPQLISPDYPEGLKTTYLQLKLEEIPPKLKKSSRKNPVEIRQGEFVGKVAAEGDSSSKEPHLHFGLVNIVLEKNRKSPRDPNPYLDPQTPGFLPMEISGAQSEVKVPTASIVTIPETNSPPSLSPETSPRPVLTSPRPVLETTPTPETTPLAVSENILETSTAAQLEIPPTPIVSEENLSTQESTFTKETSPIFNDGPLPHLHFGVKKEPYGSLDYLVPLSLLPPLTLKGEGEGELKEAKDQTSSPVVEEVSIEEVLPISKNLESLASESRGKENLEREQENPVSTKLFPWESYGILFFLSLAGALSLYFHRQFFNLNIFRPIAKVVRSLL